MPKPCGDVAPTRACLVWASWRRRKGKGSMNRWMGSLAVSLALLVGTNAAPAAGSKDEVRKQIEASMLVQGTIDIDEEGKVTGYELKQADVVPKAMLEIVDKRVRAWQFEPVQVDGKAVRARSP